MGACSHSLPSLPTPPFPSHPLPPFPPLPFRSLYFPILFPSPFPLPPLRSSPLKYSLGERCKPQRKSNLMHFSLKIWHLVVPVLLIFLWINWPQCVHACMYVCQFFCIKKSGPLTFAGPIGCSLVSLMASPPLVCSGCLVVPLISCCFMTVFVLKYLSRLIDWWVIWLLSTAASLAAVQFQSHKSYSVAIP